MICRIVQYHLSLVDGDEPRALAGGHLQRCDACKKFQIGLAGLDQQLRATSARAPSPSLRAAGVIGARAPAFAALACALAALILMMKMPDQQVVAPVPDQRPVAQLHPFPLAPRAQDPLPSEAQAMLPSEVQAPLAPRRSWKIPPLELIASRAPMDEELAALSQDGKRGMDAILSLGRRK